MVASTDRERPLCPASTMAGFTLIELLLAIAIVAILSAAAVPSYMQHIQGERAEAVNREFASAVLVARSTSIKSGTPTVFCGSSDAAGCDGNWSAGWIVFSDDDRDGVKDTAESFVLRRIGKPNQVTLAVTAPDGSTVTSTQFNYRGAPSTALAIKATSGLKSRTASVTPFGKPRIDD